MAPRAKPPAVTQQEKFFPNGISATVRSIVYGWHSQVVQDGKINLSIVDFVNLTKFAEIYYKTSAMYSKRTASGDGRKPRTKKSIENMVHDIMSQGSDIQFYKLRAFANFVGLPTGVFLVYSRLISDERENRNSDFRQDALVKIAALRRFLDKAEGIVKDSSLDNEMPFTREDLSQEHGYLPRIEVLKALSDAYNARA